MSEKHVYLSDMPGHAPSSTATAPASSETAPPVPPERPPLISRLSSLLHGFAEFMERHPVATLELGQLLMQVQSAGLSTDELEQLRSVVIAPASTEG